MKRKNYRWFMWTLLSLGTVLLFVSDLAIGSVAIPWNEVKNILIGEAASKPSWEIIVRDVRLPRACMAILAGVALSVSGLQMQTMFRNALAGPFVLGIGSGASLGVALVSMGAGVFGMSALWVSLGAVAAAIIGSAFVLLLVLLVSSRFKDAVSLLIFGLMIGHITSAIVSVLQYFTEAEQLKGFVMWGMGTFGTVSQDQFIYIWPFCLIGCLLALWNAKSLNVLLLGDRYAASMGVKVKQTHRYIILSAALLAGTVTAYCGPIAFLGLAVPHFTRSLLATADHKILIPAAALFGAFLALACDIISQWPWSEITLPLNAVSSLLGAPVVIWVILKQRQY